MIAVILAAGVSTRLRPLTDTIPKSLLPLGGTPLLRRTLEALRFHSIEHTIIVTGYLREVLERSVEEWKTGMQVQFTFNPHFASTNNNYSLWTARASAADHDLLLLDADILFDRRIVGTLLQSPHHNALVMRRSPSLGEEEIKIELDTRGRVTKVGKDVDARRAVGESVGIEKFSRATAARLFETLDQRKHLDEFYEASFQDMIERGTEIYAVESGAYTCIEIDTPEDLRNAEILAGALKP